MLLSGVCDLLNGGSFSLKPSESWIWKHNIWMSYRILEGSVIEKMSDYILGVRRVYVAWKHKFAAPFYGMPMKCSCRWDGERYLKVHEGEWHGREQIQGWKGRSLMGGWHSEKELDGMSFGVSETSILLHHWIKGLCLCLFNSGLWIMEHTEEVSFQWRWRHRQLKGNQFSIFCSYCMCVYVCLLARQLACVFANVIDLTPFRSAGT